MADDTATPGVNVTVRIAGLDPARAPQVCLKTGEAAQCLVPTTAVATPDWAWVLILAGGAPFFIARQWSFRKAGVSLPAKNEIFERRELFRRGTLGVFTVIGIIALYALVTVNLPGIALSVVLATAATAAWRSLLPRVWVDAQLDGDRITLVGVHPSAARAFGGGAR